MIYGLFFSVIGYVFTKVLMEDVLSSYTRFLQNLPPWINKPLGLCPMCFTGQLSFWGMLPFLKWDYQIIIMYFGIISINIIIVRILSYAEKD